MPLKLKMRVFISVKRLRSIQYQKKRKRLNLLISKVLYNTELGYRYVAIPNVL